MLPKTLPLPPDELDDEILSNVESIWGRGPNKTYEFLRHECSKQDLRSLKGNLSSSYLSFILYVTHVSGASWLNDKVINFYYALIAEEAKEEDKKVHYFDTLFYRKIRDQGHSAVKRWTKKINIFEYDR